MFRPFERIDMSLHTRFNQSGVGQVSLALFQCQYRLKIFCIKVKMPDLMPTLFKGIPRSCVQRGTEALWVRVAVNKQCFQIT